MSHSLDAQIVSHHLFADPKQARALFAQLRREDPVHHTCAPGYPAAWAITKHADIMEVERQAERFVNAPLTFIRPSAEQEIRMKETNGTGQYFRLLVAMDGNDHRAHRAIAQAWFMPQNLKRVEQLIHEKTTELIDQMEATGGSCDFAMDVAQWFPLRVMMTLLGIPDEDHAWLLRMTQQLLAPVDPELKRDEADRANAASVSKQLAGEYLGYFGKVAQDRRVNPRDDLATLLVQAQPDGKPIGPLELVSYFLILATAGHDTTAASLGGGLLALMEHPEQFERLRREPALLPSAIEEMFRWVTPVKHFCRTAADDYVLRGKQIRKGDILLLFYPSANFDEEVFADPERFRIDRTPNKQIAFGFGPHVCLGQHLARQELKTFFTELMRRLPRIEMAGKPELVISNEVGGVKHLPVRYETVRA